MIHLELQPELEAQLALEAKAFGISIERYVEQIITDQAIELDAAEARAGINRGLADLAAGRSRPAHEVFDELRAKYQIPR